MATWPPVTGLLATASSSTPGSGPCHSPVLPSTTGVAGGPGWIKAVGAALPMLRINPTSGTDLSNAAELVRAGVHSMGFVAPLFDPTDIANQVRSIYSLAIVCSQVILDILGTPCALHWSQSSNVKVCNALESCFSTDIGAADWHCRTGMPSTQRPWLSLARLTRALQA